jgi:hypothetical protein
VETITYARFEEIITAAQTRHEDTAVKAMWWETLEQLRRAVNLLPNNLDETVMVLCIQRAGRQLREAGVDISNSELFEYAKASVQERLR